MAKTISNGRRFSYAKQAELTWLLMTNRRSSASLAKSADISRTAAQNWINALHGAGCIHIDEWIKMPRSTRWTRIWAWGHGDDAPRPRAKTSAERNRISRDRSTLDKAWRVAA